MTDNIALSVYLLKYGGPDGELGASMRYLSQRYIMPYSELKAILTDIGTEELGHLEMIGAIVHQLTRNLSEQQIMNSGFAPYYVDHTAGIYPVAASGFPWSASSMQSKGDPITDLHEDLAADGAGGYRLRELFLLPFRFFADKSVLLIQHTYKVNYYEKRHCMIFNILWHDDSALCLR